MIFNAIVTLVVNFFHYLLSFAPDVDATALLYINSGLYNFKVLAAPYNWIFPVDTFYFVLNFNLVLWLIIAYLKLTLFIGGLLTGGVIRK